MILGIGVDIAENARFASMPENLEKKLYSDNELQLADISANRAEYLASRFAAKEAFSKALGTGFKGLSVKDVEVFTNKSGKPYIVSKASPEGAMVHLSISHERAYSVAMVVIEDGQK